ncbi:MAG: hypothetical protein WKG07_33360 [Hymenobacter sp.]
MACRGCAIGDAITIPGEEIGKAIRKLWAQGILGDVSVTIARIEGDKIFLDFNLKERPRLSKFTFDGHSQRPDRRTDQENYLDPGQGGDRCPAEQHPRRQVRKFFVNKGYSGYQS